MKLARQSYGTFLAGEWIDGGDAVEIHSPFSFEVVGSVRRATGDDLKRAIAAASAAFEVTRRMGAWERQRILRNVANGMRERRDEFVLAICLEAGKPITTARAEFERALFTMEIAAEESTRIYGETIPLDLQEFASGRWSIVRRVPVGPIAAITPFNFPLNLVCHKLGPALAVGCPVILKPAPQTPISSLLLADVIDAAGWPKGALSVLYLSNDDAAAMIEGDGLKMLSFTGSAAVGWQLKAKAGKKRVTLELGGNAGCIVHSDADLEYAATRCAVGGFSYAGQSCISVQRIFVQESVAERFCSLLVGKVSKLRVGDPLDPTVEVGPLIRESDAVRAESWIAEAVAEGARVLCGGQRHGSILEPTVLTGTRPNQKVNCAEIFAPVVTVEPYATFGEALRRVNDSQFGLQAGVFTSDARLIFQAYNELEVGGVVVGDVPTFRIDHMPYGGVKDSGIGREGIRYAIEDMTEPKLLVMAMR